MSRIHEEADARSCCMHAYKVQASAGIGMFSSAPCMILSGELACVHMPHWPHQEQSTHMTSNPCGAWQTQVSELFMAGMLAGAQHASKSLAR